MMQHDRGGVVHALAFSQDGQVLAAGLDYTDESSDEEAEFEGKTALTLYSRGDAGSGRVHNIACGKRSARRLNSGRRRRRPVRKVRRFDMRTLKVRCYFQSDNCRTAHKRSPSHRGRRSNSATRRRLSSAIPSAASSTVFVVTWPATAVSGALSNTEILIHIGFEPGARRAGEVGLAPSTRARSAQGVTGRVFGGWLGGGGFTSGRKTLALSVATTGVVVCAPCKGCLSTPSTRHHSM